MVDHVRRVAVLGTGTMGAPMARNLRHAGFGVRVWNRTMAKAAALVADGARPASDPAAAARGAEVLITMLADGATVEDAMTGPEGALLEASLECDLDSDEHGRGRMDRPARRSRRAARRRVRRRPGVRQFRAGRKG